MCHFDVSAKIYAHIIHPQNRVYDNLNCNFFSTIDEIHKNITKIWLLMAYLDNEIVTNAKCIHIASSKLVEIMVAECYLQHQ